MKLTLKVNNKTNYNNYFMFAAEMSLLQYREDSDFDEAFKNLLRPIDSITKIDSCDILQYDLIKVIKILNAKKNNMLYYL